MKNIFISILTLLCFIANAQENNSVDTTTVSTDTLVFEADTDIIEVNHFTKIDSLLEIARSFIGVKYRVGGCSSSGFDCSGFLYHCTQQLGIKIPRNSSGQSSQGQYIEVDSLQAGDFIFFNGRSIAAKSIGHVAMVTANDDDGIHIIHATTSRGVMEEILEKNSYFMQRWVLNKRLIE